MSAITFHVIRRGLRALGLTAESRVIAHASLSAFGHVRGGAASVVGALISTCHTVLMPAFTYQCLVWPLVGPPDNALVYSGHEAENEAAEIFRQDLPVHPQTGVVAETLRRLPAARRSSHPILSFTAVGGDAEHLLAAQTLAEPLAPIGRLAECPAADVLLLGVNHTANTAIHYAEYRAGRKQFIRWALAPHGAVECPHWPGCSQGFDALEPHLRPFTRTIEIGAARVQRIPLHNLLETAEAIIRADPLALLCNRAECERCQAVRRHVQQGTWLSAGCDKQGNHGINESNTLPENQKCH